MFKLTPPLLLVPLDLFLVLSSQRGESSDADSLLAAPLSRGEKFNFGERIERE